MRVLIADDSLVMRRLLEATLSGWGFEVVSAADGNEALAELQKPDAPRLAILDWIMPVFTGLEVCRLVRQRKDTAYTYLILLTSKSQREDIVEGLRAGADDYVVKPFDKHELEVRLRAGRRILDLQEELMRAQEALREQAIRDPLTNCYNRRCVLDLMEKECARSGREGKPLGVVMIDLDHFKSINDTYGHTVGDEALKQVVNLIQSQMRNYDVLGRYGGEEFLVLLPGCDDLCVASHAERLRQAVEKERIAVNDLSLRITASFGATSAPPGDGTSAGDLIRAADEALLVAKRKGRNRVIFQLPEQLRKTQAERQAPE
jgi:two-component system cell cycle response regulator